MRGRAKHHSKHQHQHQQLIPGSAAKKKLKAQHGTRNKHVPAATQQQPHSINVPPPSNVPYSASDTIMLVGEGNFSFGAALAQLLGSAELLTATCYDSQQVLHEKYPDAQRHIETIEDLGGRVVYGVDATQLHRRKGLTGKGGLGGDGPVAFTKVVFMFPHVGAGIKDQDVNISTNQRLLAGFLTSAKTLMSKHGQLLYTSIGPVEAQQGEVHITLKTGEPYDSWNVTGLAKAAGWGVKACRPFVPASYPGYEHRRTIGGDASKGHNAELQGKPCKTWVLVDGSPTPGRTKGGQAWTQQRRGEQKQAPHNKKRKRQGGDSSDSDSSDT